MNISERLRTMSENEFAVLGMQGIAYIRPIIVDDKQAYSVHAADGSRIGIAPTFESAMVGIREGNLEPLSVH
ncbi:MAG: DUF1150 domain-containing protein [Alphaproteobacteria bacterium]|nr:DUF1150 domain-containing protein [Alphaproteobacteria bacterium]